jgi:hypothetical protein
LVERLFGNFIILAGSLALLAWFLTTALLLTGFLTRRLILLAGLVLVRHVVSFHGNIMTTAQSRRRSDKTKAAIRIAATRWAHLRSRAAVPISEQLSSLFESGTGHKPNGYPSDLLKRVHRHPEKHRPLLIGLLVAQRPSRSKIKTVLGGFHALTKRIDTRARAASIRSTYFRRR